MLRHIIGLLRNMHVGFRPFREFPRVGAPVLSPKKPSGIEGAEDPKYHDRTSTPHVDDFSFAKAGFAAWP